MSRQKDIRRALMLAQTPESEMVARRLQELAMSPGVTDLLNASKAEPAFADGEKKSRSGFAYGGAPFEFTPFVAPQYDAITHATIQPGAIAPPRPPDPPALPWPTPTADERGRRGRFGRDLAEQIASNGMGPVPGAGAWGAPDGQGAGNTTANTFGGSYAGSPAAMAALAGLFGGPFGAAVGVIGSLANQFGATPTGVTAPDIVDDDTGLGLSAAGIAAMAQAADLAASEAAADSAAAGPSGVGAAGSPGAAGNGSQGPGEARGGRIDHGQHPAAFIPGIHVRVPLTRAARADGGPVPDPEPEGIVGYHGTPHDFPAERLIQHPTGEQEHIQGRPGVLPDVPPGATSVRDYPHGRFRDAAIGSGEGAQAYGHGHYMAQREGVAKQYREFLSSRKNDLSIPGNFAASMVYRTPEGTRDAGVQELETLLRSMDRYPAPYKHDPSARDNAQRALDFLKSGQALPSQGGKLLQVRIRAHPEHFLDWDKPLSEQHPMVQDVAQKIDLSHLKPGNKTRTMLEWYRQGKEQPHNLVTGSQLVSALNKTDQHGPEAASALRAAGIPGIRYLDGVSRGQGEGTHNYVVFDPDMIDIEKKYAAGGEALKRGGEVSYNEAELQRRLQTLLHPDTNDPAAMERFLKAKESYDVSTDVRGAYSARVLPMAPHDVNATVAPLQGVTTKDAAPLTWSGFHKIGKGGTLFTLGGDRSNLGRLTHINGKELAWPVDLHAGTKYMTEPNEGAVWANAQGAASALRANIIEAAKRGPVYGAFAPMGPTSVDSSVNMFDVLMSQIPSSGISAKDARAFDASLKAGLHIKGISESDVRKRVAARDAMQAWPGVMNAEKARDFAASLSGAHRGAIVKHMEAAPWQNAGFPSIGITRAAITDPELLNTAGNMMGHHVVELDPSSYDMKNLAFNHSTYKYPTKGTLRGKLPFAERQVVMPDFTDQQVMDPAVVKKTNAPLTIHPYSPNALGRAAYRGNTELRQAIQPINDRMLDSIHETHGPNFNSGGLIQDKYPTHYMPSVGRQVMKTGGELVNSLEEHQDPESKRMAGWNWTPLPQVHESLGSFKEIPSHVAAFGNFMNETAKKAATSGLTSRDLIKAYAITRASIQREGRRPEKVLEHWPEYPGPRDKIIRPEGAMGEWLQTSMGQRYLDSAVKGNVDHDAVQDAVRAMGSFGMTNKGEAQALPYAAQMLPGQEGRVSDMVARAIHSDSAPQEWRDWATKLHGIKYAKSGFLASMLGRGDQPTADARQYNAHSGMPPGEARNKLIDKAQVDSVLRLAKRQTAMNIGMPSELAPHYQHLVHHTVWDKVGNDVTTHDDLMNAMRHAASGGAIGEAPIHQHILAHGMRRAGILGLGRQVMADGGTIDPDTDQPREFNPSRIFALAAGGLVDRALQLIRTKAPAMSTLARNPASVLAVPTLNRKAFSI